MKNFINTAGKRKCAIARAVLTAGNGIVRINKQLVENYAPKMHRLKIQEPLLIVGDASKKVDICVNVSGGGIRSQTEAARLAIGRALAVSDKKLAQLLTAYDRQLLVADVRRKESRKPNCHGKARAKRHTSYR